MKRHPFQVWFLASATLTQSYHGCTREENEVAHNSCGYIAL